MYKSVLAMVFAVCFTTACQRVDTDHSAASDDGDALMQVAFPGWRADGSDAVHKIVVPPSAGQTASSADPYVVKPALVLKPDLDHAILIVKGEPTDEQGNSVAGHSAPALLGAYWFEKREHRWYKGGEQPAFSQEGFFGDPGELKQVRLSDGQFMLAVENGSCWQGACGRWLSLYLVDGKKIDNVYSGLLSSDTEGATASCEELLKLTTGERLRVARDDYSNAFGCYRIEGRWQIGPSTSGPGELVIDFGGKRTSERDVPVAPDKAQALAQADTDKDGRDYLVLVHEIHARQVLDFIDGKYAPASGNNPNPGL